MKSNTKQKGYQLVISEVKIKGKNTPENIDKIVKQFRTQLEKSKGTKLGGMCAIIL